MKRLITMLALAGLVTACSDNPTQPESATLVRRSSNFTQSGNENGRIRFFWPAADQACTMWDAEGQIVFMNCTNFYPPNADGVFGFRMESDGKILNPTGKAAQFGPTNYPPFLLEMYGMYFGVGLHDGQMPLCDWDLSKYPNAYTDWDLSTLWCTTNWSYTISASGRATMHALFDQAHTFDPYP